MHVAVIPDGNRRFMEKTNSTSLDASLESVRCLVNWCKNDDTVTRLSVFCWSSENWNRKEDEVNTAMECLYGYLQSIENSESLCYVCCSSSPEDIPSHIRREMIRINNDASANMGPSALRVYLYISYGFHEHRRVSGGDDHDDVDIVNNPLHINTMDDGIPDVDCLIRTSGEKRLSNFCLHKLGFAELVFVDSLFPECNGQTWDSCMREFKKRDRRFGM